MTSPRKVAANRRNAQRCTGPRIPGGKARVARNPLVHGLRAEHKSVGRLTAIESFVYAEKSSDATFIRDLRSAFSGVAEPAAASDGSRLPLSAQHRIGRAMRPVPCPPVANIARMRANGR